MNDDIKELIDSAASILADHEGDNLAVEFIHHKSEPATTIWRLDDEGARDQIALLDTPPARVAARVLLGLLTQLPDDLRDDVDTFVKAGGRVSVEVQDAQIMVHLVDQNGERVPLIRVPTAAPRGESLQ